MLAQGASVVGLDVSTRMVELARRRLGDRAVFHVADLAEPLDFLVDESFDVIVSSLALHYLRDWEPTLQEFHRVLVAGGRLLISTHHPGATFGQSPTGDYFATELLTDHWTKGGRTFEVHYYRRSLGSIVNSVAAARFTLEGLYEPRPGPEMSEDDPDGYRRLSTEPWYLFVTARKAVN